MTAPMTNTKRIWHASQKVGNGKSAVYVRSDTGLSTNVYHYLPWEYAKQAIENRHLRLQRPECWPDPHEKWWCDVLFQGNNNLNGVRAFAQCWTTSHLNEAFWRFHALQHHSRKNDDIPPFVRLRTTVGRLQEVCKSAIGELEGKAFIGRVEYPEYATLERLAREIRSGSHKDVARTAATALITKRQAFKFESEVRLLWIERGTDDASIRNFTFDPVHFIRQVMIGPLVSNAAAVEIRKFLKAKGFTDDSVKRSTIYKPPTA